ncbi:MAG: polymer-forming cytoskeletal protein [Candidatus Aminicenantes bacterium]|nr:polymer-forming cytoskeletal protein [Candidatus Aminicenantes bacterium]
MAFNTGKKGMTGDIEEYNAPAGSSKSFLGKTLNVTGEITCDEVLTIEGNVKGNIKVSKTLTIGANGYVEGEIKANDVKIIGKAEGNIDASGKLEISSQGNFKGSVKADKLVIEEGAVFKGEANMDSK